MRSPRTPNQALRVLLAEADWKGAQLARAVNALGAAQGTMLHYDRTTISHWLAGSRPRPPVPALVAEALSRRLGRTVPIQDTGLLDTRTPDRGARALPEGSAVERLDRMLHDTDRRRLALLGAYSLATLVIPPSLSVTEETRFETSGRPSSVGLVHVAAAREMLTVFSRGDTVFGAGAVLEPLRQYLSTTVIPWLRRDMKPSVRRELFTVAAQLTYLSAFTHFDMNHQAAAQRLYVTSIELAGEAGDIVGHALGLRALSVQAHALGHFTDAHRLAEHAVRTGARHAPAHQRAFLHGQLGVTQAARGDSHYLRHFTIAERFLERSTSDTSPVGAFHPGSLALQRAAVAKSLGDNRAAARALAHSLSHRPVDERRSRALVLAELAETQLTAGHLEQACRTWHAFLDDHPHLHSARADDRLRALTAALRPHASTFAAAALLRRACGTRDGAGRPEHRPHDGPLG
ncbi:tetratricopeptide repeat protein [Streptomyces alanosinicus]|uniref:Transcriptional regulator n=1 Tax=Streptomyces alanosinicus TaxID=68171 RepID=A0A918YKS6_9ACTN|nr:hypothetical protein [Streptomyces alanosinicus]GHE05673.1 hypothetical protein GCM10010339_42550 [Streptomyces alanosinicus]